MRIWRKRARKKDDRFDQGYAAGYAAGYEKGYHDGNPVNQIAEALGSMCNSIGKAMENVRLNGGDKE